MALKDSYNVYDVKFFLGGEIEILLQTVDILLSIILDKNYVPKEDMDNLNIILKDITELKDVLENVTNVLSEFKKEEIKWIWNT